ncbi:MAG: hypothetical protein ACLPY1_00360 [Terracidiphilus sp.]
MAINGGGEQKSHRDLREWALFCILASFLLGLLVILTFAISTAQPLSVFGVASMIGAASTLVGAFLGFLFGVPRTTQGEPDPADQQAKPAPAEGRDRSSVRPNTNLEQISDWLTKILVGAGLTQIGAICTWVRDLGASLAPGFGGLANAGAFATGSIIYFAFDGFFLAFLWTRLYLGGLMTVADFEALTNRIQEVKEQSELDARALNLVIKQLNPSTGSPPDQTELFDAIKKASGPFKAQIFYQAEEARRNNWEDRDTKPRMERAIPIFRALIACDVDGIYHANHGQLGFALKDQRNPNLDEAIAELTTAIEIRGSARDRGFEFYEFARAFCWILEDQDFKLNQKSATAVRDRIVQDLTTAGRQDYVAAVIRKHEVIAAWLKLNNVAV